MVPSGTGRFVESWLPFYEEFGRFVLWSEQEVNHRVNLLRNAMPGS
jgi:hypothetical protein